MRRGAPEVEVYINFKEGVLTKDGALLGEAKSIPHRIPEDTDVAAVRAIDDHPALKNAVTRALLGTGVTTDGVMYLKRYILPVGRDDSAIFAT
jgi:hypothetical protein